MIRLKRVGLFVTLASSLAYACTWLVGGALARGVHTPTCASLSIRDRSGHVLRELPAECAQPRAAWVAYADLPQLLEKFVVFGEDRRFQLHPGVDPVAIARAAYRNLRAGRVRSGASTLSMQLARLLQGGAHKRSWFEKIDQALRALALERRLSKAEIFEAYVNLAYYGEGAYGLASAAQHYFAKRPSALSAGELTLLAVLPRAPSAYALHAHLSRALARRSQLLARMVAAGALPAGERARIEAEAIQLAPPPAHGPAVAGHFLDWLQRELPAEERRAGGVLTTTLDAALQGRAESLVSEHASQLTAADVSQAGALVLDAHSGEVRALVGSRDYARSQVNIVTRRRELGSLLKPFVYALAIEAGESPDSIALDSLEGLPSALRARDGNTAEAGPVSYREALAGSYNLAALHVLQRVGVPALHARLREAGVAQLNAPAAHYGLGLALGGARVRLLDVAAGYAFLVRGGRVRAAQAIERLRHIDGSEYRPPARADKQIFSSEVSAQVMDILSDRAARHKRFGRGLPFDDPDAAPVIVKTGTASGLSDLSAIVACSDFIVAAWSGRFDGAPTSGLSAMHGALPLAERVLSAALAGRSPQLPSARR